MCRSNFLKWRSRGAISDQKIVFPFYESTVATDGEYRASTREMLFKSNPTLPTGRVRWEKKQ